jgi:ribosomal protein L11
MSIIKHKKQIYITSQKADSAPPLGTILGNIGVNTANFCIQFNSYTKNLPTYFKLAVFINIFDNRNFEFSIKPPAIG